MEDNVQRVKFNIRGRTFETFASTINNISNSKLAKLTRDHTSYDTEKQEYFFDRDPELFNVILNLLVTGNLHVPKHICGALLRDELSFWEIETGNVRECCWRQYFQHEDDMAVLNDLIQHEDLKNSWTECETVKERVWLILNNPGSSKLAKTWYCLYLCVVFLSIVIFCIWNIQDLRTDLYVSEIITHHYPDIHLSGNDKLTTLILTDPVPALFALETGCLLFFMVEWSVGFFVCPNKREYLSSWTHIVSFVLVFAMLMNFVMEFFKSILAENEVARWFYFIFKAISMVRLLLFIRLARRFSALRVLLLAIKHSLLELLLMAITFCIGMLFFATLIYYAEITNTNSFSSIFISMWWAIITMTTVGYGDVYPTSIAGYIVGVLCALSGLLLLAMPVAIIASNFSEYYSQNSFHQRFLKLQKEKKTTDISQINKVHPHKNTKIEDVNSNNH
ncbi:potassium voltage-gated channel protein Shaw-like [Saccostrea echinata]|uniref:potassium voltage-gated channel protein Shaw-like n=1 Tax=Saccostrea echinata TaxID=191078 RepID=UPI002A83899B|nr:potassium voltage-gated channel protein Shaw-like [Saccostrea echinata]